MNKELRTFAGEVRALAGENGEILPTISGYAAVFNRHSENMGFIEQIAPGAFDSVLNDDVRALFNHDPNYILGRTKAGTLRLFQDETGLKYEFDAPDSQTIQDLVIKPIQRGDVNQSSFGFSIAENGDKWEERDGVYYRTITKVSRLFDVSPVTFPAYPDATVAARGLDHFKDELKQKHIKDEEKRRAKIARDNMIRELMINTIRQL